MHPPETDDQIDKASLVLCVCVEPTPSLPHSIRLSSRVIAYRDSASLAFRSLSSSVRSPPPLPQRSNDQIIARRMTTPLNSSLAGCCSPKQRYSVITGIIRDISYSSRKHPFFTLAQRIIAIGEFVNAINHPSRDNALVSSCETLMAQLDNRPRPTRPARKRELHAVQLTLADLAALLEGAVRALFGIR